MTFDVDAFLALPRCDGLTLSPDGTRLVTTVTTPAPEGTRMRGALWELDPAGQRPARRLTFGATGESAPMFGPDGALYFLSARPDPDRPAKDGAEEHSALWRLPAGGGEAALVADPPGGVDAVAVARDAGTVLLGTALHPGAATFEEDAEHDRARTEAGVSARLLTGYPIRFWDHDLGPRHRRLSLVSDPPAPLTGDVGVALEEVDIAITPDGRTVLSGWRREQADPIRERVDLVALPAGGGQPRTLRGDGASYSGAELRTLRGDGASYSGMAVAPDGVSVACVREDGGHPGRAAALTLVTVALDSGEERDLLPGSELWPRAPVWAPDGAALYFTADDHGHTLPFRLDLADGRVTRLAAEGAYAHLCAAPDGQRVYALRSAIDGPPVAVALDARAPDGAPGPIPSPGDGLAAPGRVRRIAATAADGTEIGAWLVTPPTATAQTPAPLVVLAHGGPYGSWTGWHWRWNPHLFAARGYAVLLPDPAPSTGYGQDFIARGWGRWGEATATDLDAAVDAALAEPGVDGDRVALAGGSFGGYLANWVAGHRDRYAAIVTHASLWSTRTFHGTTDTGVSWEREFGDPYTEGARYDAMSPDRAIAEIRAPVLVIHGERDYRVPHAEALRLYTDLTRHGVDVRFLSFPDEHHWIVKPQHTRIWYETVLAFLDTHLLGAEWARPALL